VIKNWETGIYALFIGFTLVFISCDDSGNGSKTGTTPIFGTGDDIQTMIDAAKSGDTITIPNGTYTVTKMIFLKSEITLKGESQDNVCLEVPYMSQDDNFGSVFEIPSMANNIEISYITFLGNDSFAVYSVIHMINAENIKIHHVTIKNFDGDTKGIFAGYGNATEHSRNIEISNCVVDSIGPSLGIGSEPSVQPTGIMFDGYHTGITIQDNVVKNIGFCGIKIASNCTDISIKRNIVKDMYYKSLDNDGCDIELWGYCSNAVVEDNEIDYWLSVDYSSYVAVRRNTIGKNATGTNYVALELAGTCTNNIFTDNVLAGKHKAGIGIWGHEEGFGASYSYFSRNSVSDMSGYGVLIASVWQNTANKGNKYLFFKDCDFTGTKKGGEWGNGSGIGFWSTSDYITFDNCRINNNAGYGVVFQYWVDENHTDHLSFVNCTIKNNNDGVFNHHSNYTAFEFQGGTVDGDILSQKPFNNEKPVVVITGSDSGSVGASITFTSNSSVSHGSAGHILWDLDDSFPLNGDSVTHTYAKAGTYKVTLIIWDNDGRGSVAEKTVTIR